VILLYTVRLPEQRKHTGVRDRLRYFINDLRIGKRL